MFFLSIYLCVCVYIYTHTHTHIYIYIYTHTHIPGFPGNSVVKNLPANAGDAGSIPGQEELLEKEMAIHSSILA